MPTELYWPRRCTFVDRSDERRAYAGPGTFEVPDDRVESYLDRGWERPEDSGGSEALAVADQSEAEPDADAAFDAAAFVDDAWQAVVAAIEAGEADGHLDAVRSAEQDRDSPRTSVIEALDQRQSG